MFLTFLLTATPVLFGAAAGGAYAYRHAARDTYHATGWCLVCRRYKRADDHSSADQGSR